MENHHVGEVGPCNLEHAVRWAAVQIDLAVAFIREHQEAEPPRQRNEPREVADVGHRTLGIGW